MAADPWLSSPLDVVLKDAGTLLGQEDTMLPTAFRLLDRLKVSTSQLDVLLHLLHFRVT